jgi:hypothetical protein
MQHGIAVPKVCRTLLPHLVANEVRSEIKIPSCSACSATPSQQYICNTIDQAP